METINDAIDSMMSQVPPDQWKNVNVSVAPSVVTIIDAEARRVQSFPIISNHFQLFIRKNLEAFRILGILNLPN